ncbi:hypothetical protein GH714_018307 [Hevea brasiliensis]|uniref:Uncharacterized protein n=1 Tax=Hevea brasiliensis TaxID=3981 RepID=A0A6A6LHI9_HEVBR|nr:hypothetical protein GH714_018307 [Hevea brasiliensis]
MKSNQVTKSHNVKPHLRKRNQVETESSSEEEENFPDSDDSLPPEKKSRECQVAAGGGDGEDEDEVCQRAGIAEDAIFHEDPDGNLAIEAR